jgi:hypothetical protein
MPLPILTGDRVSNINRRLEMAVATVRSPYSGQDRTQDWGGRWWAYDVQLGPWHASRSAAEARAVQAFFTGLEATSGRFLFADPSAVYTGGYVALGLPTVNGNGQTGRTLATTGWTPHAVLRAGMCFSVGTDTATRFYMLTADVTVNGSGQATLSISPSLRESPATGTALDYAAPKVQLRIPSAVAAQVATGAYYTFAFTAEEAF